MFNSIIRFCLEQKLVVILVFVIILGAGLSVMPFEGEFGIPRNPVPVDAIPDIGENQQIVFTSWPGRSPKDIDDQVTYPLTVSLLGVPGVKTVRSTSMFGFSSVYVIFEDGIDFYWSRSRILERLNTAQGSLPEGVRPVLGPDATALGQVFWYTLEGKGFDLFELRTIQDWTVRYLLQAVPGVSEVSSVGGMVKEYQVDIDPEALRAFNIGIPEVVETIKRSNLDVGANTIEINRVEYLVRGIGFIKSARDLENSVIRSVEGIPITIGQVAKVGIGPAGRRGALDKEGAEVVGGVVVTRYAANPLQVINDVKKRIEEVSAGLPGKTLEDGTFSRVKIVPFYDRTDLIKETLGTLKDALVQQVLITIIVVVTLLMHFKSSLLISGLLPIAVLMTFIPMKLFGIDANVMSLAGIAIAIGTMVDMGIILCENIVRHLDEAPPEEPRLEVIYRATCEVGSALVTSMATTIISSLVIFTMEGAEGKLFIPLAFSNTFAMIASLIVSLTLLPVVANLIFEGRKGFFSRSWLGSIGLVLAGYLATNLSTVLAVSLFSWAGALFLEPLIAAKSGLKAETIRNSLATFFVGLILADIWRPLGIGRTLLANAAFVFVIIGSVLGSFRVFEHFYERILRFLLAKKAVIFGAAAIFMLLGTAVWIGFNTMFGFVPAIYSSLGGNGDSIRATRPWVWASHALPGLGREFMPPLDEGSYLLMPTTMPHASIGEALDVMRKQNMAIRAIPEVDMVVGKIGRVESALDPAPVSMIETVITVHPEYAPADPVTGERKRLWREEIRRADDIWDEIVRVSKLPGTTSAPRLQPINARIVMLQTGIRASMGIQIQGKTLEDIESFALALEPVVRQVGGVNPDTVFADRVVGKPYLEIHIDRDAIARYGIRIQDVQNVIETAVGGSPLSYTVEGRERFAIRLRYARELRNHPEEIQRILVPTQDKTQIPLAQIARIEFNRGPQMIKSENTFLVSYLLFDKLHGHAEIDVVEAVRDHLSSEIDAGRLKIPDGANFTFIGSYQNQLRAEKTMRIILPISLMIIFIILYLQFGLISTSLLVFSGVLMVWSGGFLLLWLYGQSWFLNFSIAGINLRELFNIQNYNLSVAVWVGFIAIFGVASDDGVVIATYLDDTFASQKPQTVEQIREAVVTAGMKRIRPCLMTTATTILALLPVITSTGRGADVMIPMAIPSIGGMCLELITLFLVPVGYCWLKEHSAAQKE